MKRILCIILTLFLLLTAIGCNKESAPNPNETESTTDHATDTNADTTETEEETTGEDATDEQIVVGERTPSPANIHVVRTKYSNWSDLETKLIAADFCDGALNADRLSEQSGNSEHLPLLRIDTLEELNRFKEIYRGTADKSTPTELDKATEKMDADFMRYYSLFIVYFTSGSISHTFEVQCLSNDAADLLSFNVVQEPTDGLVFDMMGSWIAIIPLDTRTSPCDKANYDATFTTPEQIPFSGEQIIYVNDFDPSFSTPQATQFYEEALNAERLQMVHPHIRSTLIFCIDSREELNTFLGDYGDLLSDPPFDFYDTASITEATATLGDAFFETHSLIAVYALGGSSAVTYHVERLDRANGTLTVYMAENPSGMGFAVMTGWMALIPIEKSALEGITDFDAFRVAYYY